MIEGPILQVHQSSSPLEILPTELILGVISFLRVKDICNLSLAGPILRQIVEINSKTICNTLVVRLLEETVGRKAFNIEKVNGWLVAKASMLRNMTLQFTNQNTNHYFSRARAKRTTVSKKCLLFSQPAPQLLYLLDSRSDDIKTFVDLMDAKEKELALNDWKDPTSMGKLSIHCLDGWIVFNVVNLAYDELIAEGPEVMRIFGLFGRPQLGE